MTTTTTALPSYAVTTPAALGDRVRFRGLDYTVADLSLFASDNLVGMTREGVEGVRWEPCGALRLLPSTALYQSARAFRTVFDRVAVHSLVSHLNAGEVDALAAVLATTTPERGVETVAAWMAEDAEWDEWAEMPLRWAETYPDLWVGAVEFFDVPDVDSLREFAAAAAARHESEAAEFAARRAAAAGL